MKTFKQFLREGINDKGIFKAVFLGGQAGSGKSYVAKKISDGQIDVRIVNTDKFLEFIANKRNISLGAGFSKEKEEFKKIVTDAKILTDKQLMGFINGMLPLLIDATSANIKNILKRNGILESFGYDTAMIWINTSLETSIKRAAQRTRQVPEKVIKNMFANIEENKKFFRSKFKIFFEIDNNDGELTEKIIQKAFKKMGRFFNSDIKNPLGKQMKKELLELGQKELVPSQFSKSQLTSVVSAWTVK